MVISPEDGLPIPADESPQLALAPAFSIDNMVCIEDARTFVEVFDEDLRDEEAEGLARLTARPRQFAAVLGAAVGVSLAAFAAAFLAESLVSAVLAMLVLLWGFYRAQATRGTGNGTRSAYDAVGHRCQPAQYTPAMVKTRFGVRYVRTGVDGKIVVVRPKREACEHYRRQLFANDEVLDPEAPGGKVLFRNCMKRRSIGGAFMSLRDEAVFACEYREPRSPEHDKKLDTLDEKILKKSDERTMVPLFNISKKPDKKAIADAVATEEKPS